MSCKYIQQSKAEQEVYMKDNPDKDKFNVSYGWDSHIEYKPKKEGQLTYFNTKGWPIHYHGGGKGRSTRIDVYPDGGMWNDDTNTIGKIILVIYILKKELKMENLQLLYEFTAILEKMMKAGYIMHMLIK